jgi:phage-related minor tail protein
VVDDKDVWRVAKHVIEEHGAAAPAVAAEYAKGFRAAGKVTAQKAWTRIGKAVAEMQRATPRNGEAVN